MMIQEVPDTQPPFDLSINLNPVESSLRQLLCDVAEHIDQTPAPSGTEQTVPKDLVDAKMQLRFSGGWVRDKLMGLESHDIDVAINKMTGYQFGLRMKEYLELPGVLEKYELGDSAANDQGTDPDSSVKKKLVGGLHKIEANPEKSKHLETVTTRILDLDIDLVNLRKETYSEDSRNPQMEFGTPEEDALRRDATVNALFYNIHTGLVEDYTGRGLEDMQKRIIRTPLAPYQTFKDDPLRVLRLIRFASRLDFQIDKEAEVCMGDQGIKDALRLKISRERVGIEVEKMLRGPDPKMALELIDRLNLYDTIFTDPTKDDLPTPSTQAWAIAYDCAQDLLGAGAEDSTPSGTFETNISSTLIRNKEDDYLAWILTALTPWIDTPDPPRSGSKIPPPVAASVAKEGIKANNKVFDVVVGAFRNAEEIKNLKDGVVEAKAKAPSRRGKDDSATARDTLGMAIRRWGPNWRSHALLALLRELIDRQESRQDVLKGFSIFLSHLETEDLLSAYSLKPILSGKQIAEALEIKPGPWMKDALDVVMAWQLRHPHASSADEALDELRSGSAGKGELTNSLIAHFLAHTIRPLFAKSNGHPGLTPHGRKAVQSIQSLHRKHDFGEAADEPWKRKDAAYALQIFKWVLQNAEPAIVETHWPLIMPPLLTLIDDPSPAHKTTGCNLLSLLLRSTPPAFLARTGLGDLLQAALMPCLAYLPPLTPEADSLPLLAAAYPALISLSRARFASAAQRGEKALFLDAVLRDGFLRGYAHGGDHVRVAEVLLTQLVPLLDELAVYSVRHLHDLVTLLARDVLDAPFGSAYPPLLLAAATALQALVRNAWPRVAGHRAEILVGVTGCWLRIFEEQEDEGPEKGVGRKKKTGHEAGLDETKKALMDTVVLLRAAVLASDSDCGEGEGDDLSATDGASDDKHGPGPGPGKAQFKVDWANEMASLVSADERLRGLLLPPPPSPSASGPPLP
ncbi:MAG: hypothetical protein M1819_001274 [Sarea resinae]|nr:MAG: hypothetical protein M1819_001274 [Sarea resinae]